MSEQPSAFQSAIVTIDSCNSSFSVPTVNALPNPFDNNGVAKNFGLRSELLKVSATMSARPSPLRSATRRLSQGVACRRLGIVHMDCAVVANWTASEVLAGALTLRRTSMVGVNPPLCAMRSARPSPSKSAAPYSPAGTKPVFATVKPALV